MMTMGMFSTHLATLRVTARLATHRMTVHQAMPAMPVPIA